MGGTNADTDVLVLGGGIIGLACAHFLLLAGRSVRIVDMGRLGSGCSSGNCGLITPSHAAPLTSPGMLRTALRALVDRHAPLHVKPLPGPTTLRWLLKFASNCNLADMQRSTAARAALLNSSRRLYDSLIQSNAFECDWAARGVLVVFRDAQAMHGAEARDAALEEYGVSGTPYVGGDLQQLEPTLCEDLYGGRLYTMDAQVRPERLVAEMERVVRAAGAKVEEGCTVLGVRVGRHGVEYVETPRGVFAARDVVLAAGAWSAKLARSVGVRLPIEPGKGYSITIDRQAGIPKHACILHERSVGVTPWEGGFRLGGTMEFAGFDARRTRTRLVAILRGAAEYLRDTPPDLESTTTWCGWRPMTPDELPVIGRAQRHRNLVVAAGHGMMGVSMAPATGRLVAEIVTGAAAHVDPAPYRLERF